MTNLNTLIEQQKERAKNKATGVTFNPTNDPQIKYFFSPEDLDTLITETHQQAIAEVVRIVRERQIGWLGKEEDGSDRHPHYDELQVIIEAITSNKE